MNIELASNTWGRDVVEVTVDGRPCKVYEPRPPFLGSLVADMARWPDRTCLVQGELRVTYAELVSRVARLSSHLQSLTAPKDPVLLVGYNSIEWITAFWAIAHSGRVAVLGNAWWSHAEYAHAVAVIQPTLAIADVKAQQRLGTALPVLTMQAARRMATDASHAAATLTPTVCRETDAALVVFTSGTTGAPKGVILSNGAAVANIHNLALRAKRLPSELPEDHRGTVSLMGLPLFHIGGVQSMASALLSGGKVVFLDGKFEPEKALQAIESESVRFWGAVPTMVSRVLESEQFDKYDTSSIQSITMAGAMVPQDLVRRVREVFPAAAKRVGTVYGLTEAGGIVTTGSGTDLAERPGTVGLPLPVVDVALRGIQPDGSGEVIVRSPSVMSGYWGESGNPHVNEAGWLGTGDLGRIDEDGFLYIVGRIKDVIIRAGENIAAAHVEAALASHPAVSEAAVIGLSSDEFGEEVAAVVVPLGGCTVSPEDLAAHASQHLAHFAVPTRWWIRREGLPTNSTGKVVKQLLKEALEAAPEDDERQL